MELTTTHIKLIQKLADGQFHSGQQLANELGLSRTSIWNYLKVLETMGLDLHAVKGKGTRLKSGLELLDGKTIKSGLSARSAELLDDLEISHVLASTNQHLMQRSRSGQLSSGTVCMAEMQTAGRGRLGRSWVSPYGQNLYLSFMWNFKAGLSALSGLSLACGVAICQALEELGMNSHGLKWPNDILWEGKKLGGILVEIQGESQGEYTVVVGVGVNYRMNGDACQLIDQPWADISTATNSALTGRNSLASGIIDHTLQVLNGYEQTGLAPYVERWQRYDCYQNKRAKVISGNDVRHGVAKGITELGELKLLKEDGTVDFITSGEVSLRLEGS